MLKNQVSTSIMKNREEKKPQTQKTNHTTQQLSKQGESTPASRNAHFCQILKVEHNLPYAPSHQIPPHYSIIENAVISNSFQTLTIFCLETNGILDLLCYFGGLGLFEHPPRTGDQA